MHIRQQYGEPLELLSYQRRQMANFNFLAMACKGNGITLLLGTGWMPASVNRELQESKS